jgi:hypothetical protein
MTMKNKKDENNQTDLSSHLQFNDFDLVSDDWRFVALVQCGV